MKTAEPTQLSFQPHSRVFALELQQTDLVVKAKGSRQSELIIPSGIRISRLYSCGALTEVNRGAKGGGYVRVADPTGVLVLFLKPRNPETTDILDTLNPPAFVSVIASIEAEKNPGESGFRLILEMIAPSDRSARDRWILRTTSLTLNRLNRLSSVLNGEQGSEEEKKAISRYGTSVRQLHVLGGIAQKALGQVQIVTGKENAETERSEPTQPEDTADRVMKLIRQHSGPRGVSVQELTGFAGKDGIAELLLIETIRGLIAEDELYQPSSGFVKIL